MKAIKHFVLILILSIGITVFSQPGNYYPPPSDINYHNDTLTIFPPDSLPGAPVVLLGYNIYVDSDFYDNVFVSDPEDTIDFVFDIHTLLPGQHEFCANVVYNEWISENTCDTGLVIYGFDLPFLEDWSSGSFETLQWTTNSDNWVINFGEGNPAPTLSFQGEPGLTNYEAILESFPVNALGMTIGRIWLDFDIKLDVVQISNYEQLFIQVWNSSNQIWTTVEEFSDWHGSFNWEPKRININSYAMNKVFKIRFMATGMNSQDISSWNIDNIHIYRACAGPFDLVLEENWDHNTLDWISPINIYGGWINWDNYMNYGNSIGTGDAVEFDVAARWTPEQLSYYTGASILEIAFFPAESQAIYHVRVWTGEGPDSLVVDQLVNAPVIGQWNYVTLTEPPLLDNTQELWVGYHVNTTTGYPAGVDDGPAINGYGNMMNFGGWQTLLDINPELDYNWNIACYLGRNPYGPNLYFNIYRETGPGEFQYYDRTYNTSYQDTDIVLSDYYCYKVTLFYAENGDTCESAPTNTLCEIINVGTNQPGQDRTLKIYPNPANDWLNIDADEELREVRFYNLLGEEVLKLEIGNLKAVLDVSHLKKGLYFIEVVTDSMIYKSKVLIL